MIGKLTNKVDRRPSFPKNQGCPDKVELTKKQENARRPTGQSESRSRRSVHHQISRPVPGWEKLGRGCQNELSRLGWNPQREAGTGI